VTTLLAALVTSFTLTTIVTASARHRVSSSLRQFVTAKLVTS